MLSKPNTVALATISSGYFEIGAARPQKRWADGGGPIRRSGARRPEQDAAPAIPACLGLRRRQAHLQLDCYAEPETAQRTQDFHERVERNHIEPFKSQLTEEAMWDLLSRDSSRQLGP